MIAGRYSYLRVSSIYQDIDKNKSDILHLANEKNLGKVRFVEEKVSGKLSWKKRKLADIMAELSDNDSILVSELSRLGRSMLECMEILSVATQKGINIYAVKGNWQLDHSIQSKIIAMAFSMAARDRARLDSSTNQGGFKSKEGSGNEIG